MSKMIRLQCSEGRYYVPISSMPEEDQKFLGLLKENAHKESRVLIWYNVYGLAAMDSVAVRALHKANRIKVRDYTDVPEGIVITKEITVPDDYEFEYEEFNQEDIQDGLVMDPGYTDDNDPIVLKINAELEGAGGPGNPPWNAHSFAQFREATALAFKIASTPLKRKKTRC